MVNKPKIGVPSWLGKIQPSWDSGGMPSPIGQIMNANIQKTLATQREPQTGFGGTNKPGWQNTLEQTGPIKTDDEWKTYHGALDELNGLVSKGDSYAIKFRKWLDGQLVKRPVGIV